MLKIPIFRFPPIRILVLCALLDAAWIASTVVYYQTLAYLNVIPSLSSTALLSAWYKPVVIAAFLLCFWIAPVGIYTFFKAIKLPWLATGRIAVFDRPGTLLFVNLFFGGFTFLCFAALEWLGEMINEAMAPIISGGFLAAAFLFIGVWACITHAHLFRRHSRPLQRALWSPLLWKKGVIYIGTGVIFLATVNGIAYLLLAPSSPSSPHWVVLGFSILSGLGISALITMYQWDMLTKP